MLQENTPDALCMYEIHIKDREIAVPNFVEFGDKGNFSRITSDSCCCFVSGCTSVTSRFRVPRFENAASCKNV